MAEHALKQNSEFGALEGKPIVAFDTPPSPKIDTTKAVHTLS